MTLKKILIALALMTSTGCAQALSTDIKTGSFHASFTLTGNSADAAEAHAVFQVGNSLGTYIELVGGDEVTCNGLPLQKEELLGMISYQRQMTYSMGTAYEFIFTRPGETPYKATITLPSAVDLTAPASVTRGQAIAATWTATTTPSDLMKISFTRPNSEGFYQNQSTDAGTVSVPGAYTAADTPGVTGTLKLSRERAGTNPTGLSGTTRAVQERSASVVLN